jgi:peptide/nickel transport system permease protein
VSDVSWGTNLYWAQNNAGLLVGAWWTFIPSGLCVALVAFAFALVNYAMDEITNPRLRAEKEITNVFKKRSTRGILATPVIRS